MRTPLDQKTKSELQIFNLTKRIERQKNGNKHILRMTTDENSNDITKLHYKPIEHQSVRAPTARWKDILS